MIMEFEKEFGISIPDEQIMEFHTVRDVEEFLEKNK
jgi:acyl carrier protein